MWTIEFSPEINRLKTHQFKQKTMPQTRPDLDKSNGKVVRFLLGFFLMKKIIILFFFALILSGCGTTAGKMKKGKIQLGMSKDEFCMATVSFRFSRDPCSGTFMEGFNNTARGIYYPETQMEIMHDLAMEYFFVFNKVSKPFNYDTLKSGTGYLHKIFEDYEAAKEYAAKRDLNFDKDIIYNSKKGCEAEGLKAGTDEFAECTLKKIKELSK